MPTRTSPEYSRIARAFIAGERVPAPSKTATGLKRLYADLYVVNPRAMFSACQAALFSYGPHFPALIRDQNDDSFLLNESDYAPEDYERDNAGFRQSYYSRRKRPSFSPTTRRQLNSIADELRRAGKERTDETIDLDGFTFRVWK